MDAQQATQMARYTIKMNLNWRTASLTLCILLMAFSGAGSLADIRDTPHNFTRKDGGKRADDKEVCVFCHTPAISVTGGVKPVTAPAWQHSIGKDLVFTIYDDIGRLGSGKASVGSQSVACMSCHDNNQAMGVSSTSDDHPFGVPYRGFLKSTASIAPPKLQSKNKEETPFIAAKGLVATDDFREASSGTIEGRTIWWVSQSGITVRRGKGDLPLYVRTEEGGAGGAVPHIECSSCHDPHSSNMTFLRVENSASRLCLTCHDK